MARRPLDPLDLHGHHIVTSDELHRVLQGDEAERERARHRRRLVHGLVLILTFVVLIVALILVLAMVQGYRPFPVDAPSASASASPAATVDAAGCPVSPIAPAAPGRVQVRVLNATATPGLAATVGARLHERGFVVTGVGNRTVQDGAAVVVVAGTPGRATALTVQRQIPGSVYREDGRAGTSVDLILGTEFDELADAGAVDTTGPGRLRCAR